VLIENGKVKTIYIAARPIASDEWTNKSSSFIYTKQSTLIKPVLAVLMWVHKLISLVQTW
jgi:hypothetical protein